MSGPSPSRGQAGDGAAPHASPPVVIDSSENGAHVGYCGLYCGACYHRRAGLAGGEALLVEAALRGRPAEGYACQGCRSAALYQHPGCARCEIRACAVAQRFSHCGECPHMPCARLRALESDGRPHHRDITAQLRALRREGTQAWAAQQAQRWTCGCGARFAWYDTRCAACGAHLDSYGRDPQLPPPIGDA